MKKNKKIIGVVLFAVMFIGMVSVLSRSFDSPPATKEEPKSETEIENVDLDVEEIIF